MQFVPQINFGSQAPLNFGSIGAQNPFNFQSLQLPAFNGQLTMPSLYAPTAMLSLGLPQTNAASDHNQLATDTNNTGVPDWLCLLAPTLCLDKPYVQGTGAPFEVAQWLGGFFKKAGLLLLALILLAFGLYMLANSTDTGKAIIRVAKTAG